MARVFLAGGLRDLAGGASEIEVDAPDVRALVRALNARFPGFAERVDGAMSIAIDGDIIDDPFLEPLQAHSEVHFLPPVSGG